MIDPCHNTDSKVTPMDAISIAQAPDSTAPRTLRDVVDLGQADPIALFLMTEEQVRALPEDAQRARGEILLHSEHEVTMDDISKIYHVARATVGTWKWRQNKAHPQGRVSSRFTRLPKPLPHKRQSGSRGGQPSPVWWLRDVVSFGITGNRVSNTTLVVFPGKKSPPGRTPNSAKAS